MKKFILVSLFLLFSFLFLSVSSAQAATLYYNAAVDNDWNTLGNWWTDAGFTTPAISFPSTSDDVIVSENVDSNTGPAASVNMMTVGGASNPYTAISVIVANGAILNDSSYNNGTVTGDATFNDSSYNLNTVTGDATFNDSSFNVSFVTGNATFNDLSYNPGVVSGNAVFNYASLRTINLNNSQQWGTVNGTTKGSDGLSITKFIFNDSSQNIGTVPGNAIFNDLSFNSNGSVSGNATFNDSSYNDATVSGNATFNDLSYNNNATVSGNATFNDSSYNDEGSISGDATFNNSSYNRGIISGNATFNDSSLNDIFCPFLCAVGFVVGNATFNDSSQNNSTVSGDASFYDSAVNGGIVSGDACFAPSADPDGGTVTGSISRCAPHSTSGGSGSRVCKEGETTNPTTGAPCPISQLAQVPEITEEPQTSPTSICSITPRLSFGNKGDEVKCLQTKLNNNLVIDGMFGPLTKAAVIKFQLANNLAGDGIVGVLTRAVLNK